MDTKFGVMHNDWVEPRSMLFDTQEEAEAHIPNAFGPDSDVYVVKIQEVKSKAAPKATDKK